MSPLTLEVRGSYLPVSEGSVGKRSGARSSPGQRRAVGCALGAVFCAAGCELDIDSLGNIILTGPSGTASHIVGDTHTYALPHRFLAPPSTDAPGTAHALGFQHPAPERQEIIAFDLDWSEPIVVGPQPTIDYVPVINNYVSVLSGSSKTYTFDLAPTAHVVRYWHGACAAKTPWKEVFDPISEGVFKGLAEGASSQGASSIGRLYDVFQPYFIGAHSVIEHGFSFEAYYDIHGGPLSFIYGMNPAYEFHVRPDDGLVRLESVHQGVVPSSPAIQQALQTEIPAKVAEIINKRLTFSLHNPIFLLRAISLRASVHSKSSALVKRWATPAIQDTYVSSSRQASRRPASTRPSLTGRRSKCSLASIRRTLPASRSPMARGDRARSTP